MLRIPLVCLVLLAAAWLEFKTFPGHSYLEGETLIYVPMLERAAAPGLLSRDLVAKNPALALTAYDEAALLLIQAGRQPLARVLRAQQFLFRLAALVGLYLLARALSLNRLWASIVAIALQLGATLAGPNVSLNDREPVPSAFAFGLILLAMGLLAREFPLFSGVAGGLAFLYDPMLTAPFWLVLLLAFAFDRRMRPFIRPMLPICLIFVLLLANLAQLQPGTAAQPLFSHVSAPLTQFQRAYAPELYITAWPHGELYQLAALLALGGCAATRCWLLLSAGVRWLLIGTGICGVVSIPLSYALLDIGHFTWAAHLQPTRTLLFTLTSAALLFGLAGFRAILERRPWEALGWFFVLYLLPVSRGLFNAFEQGTALALAFAFAALLTGIALGFGQGPARFSALLAPLAAAVYLAYLPGYQPPLPAMRQSITQMAQWADSSTWGSSVFLFPDAGRASYPSVFRALSRHGLWVDWTSARGVLYSQADATRWRDRWLEAMQVGFSPEHLEEMLSLPIDYYVVRPEHRLAEVRRAFTTLDFVVYDAEDLRNAPKPLRAADASREAYPPSR